MGKMFFSKRLFLVLLPVAGLLVYSKALGAPFVFDDGLYVLKNPWIRSLSNLADLSASRYMGDLSFALNYRLSGAEPLGYHLVNVIIHIVNAALLFFIIRAVFSSPLVKGSVPALDEASRDAVAALTSLIFLCHPVNTQAVTYVSQRYTSLAALFYLGALLFYLKARLAGGEGGGRGKGGESPGRGRLFYLVSIISTVLAMKTKEISFTIPFMIAILEAGLFHPEDKRRYLRLVPFFLTLFIIPLSILLPAPADGNAAQEFMRLKKMEDLGSVHWYPYLLTQSEVVVTYLRLVFVPVNQKFNYHWPLATSLFDPRVLASTLFLSSVMILSVSGLIRSVKRRSAPVALFSLGLIWFFLTLSVESSVIPIRDVINEHRLYLPIAGIIFSSVCALFYLKVFLEKKYGAVLKTPAFAALLLALIVLPLSLAAYSRNEVWSDPLSLYADEVEKNPVEAGPHLYLGLAYAESGQTEEAAREFERAVGIKPDFFTARGNLANTYLRLGKVDDAMEEYRTLIKQDPSRVFPHFNLAVLYMTKGLYDDAEKELEETLRLEPGNTKALTLLNYLGSGLEEKIIIN